MTIAPHAWMTTRMPLHELDSRSGATRVLAALRGLAGVRSAAIEPGSRTAVVEHLTALDAAELVRTVRAAGGDPGIAELTMPLANTAGSEGAASLVEADLRALPGVREAAADLAIGEILVRYDPRETDAESIRRRIRAFGWDVGHPGAATSAVMDEVEARATRRIAGRAAVASLGAILATWLGAFTHDSVAPVLRTVPDLRERIAASVPLHPLAATAILALLATVVAIWSGSDLLRGAMRDLARRAATARLGTAVAVGGLLAASLAAAVATALGRPQPLLFGVALWTLAVVLVGQWLAQRLPVARRRRSRSTTPAAAAPILDRLAWHRSQDETAAARRARLWGVTTLGIAIICPALLLAFDARWPVAVLAFASVLVAAAPAAFLLGIVVPFRTTIEELSLAGIVVSGGATLERITRVRLAAMNARGGVCNPAAEISELLLLDGIPAPELLAHAAVARTKHEYARALIRPRLAAASPQVPGEAVLATSAELSREGVSTDPLRDEIDVLERQGKSVLLVADRSRLLGGIALVLHPRPGAAAAITRLGDGGTPSLLVTGHPDGTAATIAASLGIDRYAGDARDEDKRRLIVESATSTGAPVAWISDGTDEETAAAADLAITFADDATAGSGADDVRVTAGGFEGIGALFATARAVRERARKQTRLLTAYHAVALPLAGGALYPWTGLLPSPFLSAVVAAAVVLVAARSRSWREQ